MKLTIMTPTHNRAQLLDRLYNTLLAQSVMDFEWLVINDGSTDDTDNLMKNILDTHSGLFPIRYFFQENRGKGAATNNGIENLKDTEFVLIVDDDEILYNNAVEIVIGYIDKYKDTDCGGIDFFRDDFNGVPITNKLFKEDYFMGVHERSRKHISSDGYTGYFVDKIGDVRFPIFNGEKYIGPVILQTLIGRKYSLLQCVTSIGTTEYLEGGLSKRGRALRVKNPKSMILHCVFKQDPAEGVFNRVKYSIMGYAYMYYSGLSKRELLHSDIAIDSLMTIGCIPGILLAMIWKSRYGDAN